MLGHLWTWCQGLQEFLKLFHLLSWIRKNAGFQTPPPRGKGCASSIISLGGRSEARIWSQWARELRPLDSSLKGGPGITTKMELRHCKVFWEDERLEGSPVRLGGSPAFLPGVFAKPLTSGALLPED